MEDEGLWGAATELQKREHWGMVYLVGLQLLYITCMDGLFCCSNISGLSSNHCTVLSLSVSSFNIGFLLDSTHVVVAASKAQTVSRLMPRYISS